MRLNGLDFHVEVDGSGPPLLLLHGFTGSTRVWDELRTALQDVATVIGVDVIGHARSAAPAEAERYAMEWAARDLAALLDALDVPTTSVLGYSMGGRVALYFAVRHPERLRTLLLESASPGIPDAAQRSARAASDDALAEELEREGLEAFVARWERLPLLEPAPHVSVDARAIQHGIRLAHTPLGLANSLRGMGTGRQPSLWDDLRSLDVPTLVISGARDERYTTIAQQMQSLLPRAVHRTIAEAGHTAHVDQPFEFARLVRDCVQQPLLTTN